MEVRFKTKKLEKCFLEHKAARCAWPDNVARKYVQLVLVLQNIRDTEDLTAFRQYGHEELKGNRAGEHVLRLSDQYRLHFVIEEGSVVVTEVSKHYGD